MQITLNQIQYLEFKAIFDYVCNDDVRLILNNIFYNSEKEHFFATNGTIARYYYIDWDENDNPKPNKDFLLSKDSFILSKAQLIQKYGKYFQAIPIDTIEIDEDNKYPDYNKVIPTETKPIEHFGVQPNKLLEYIKSYYVVPHFFEFALRGSTISDSIGPILIYIKNENYNIKNRRILSGIIMPAKIIQEGGYKIPESKWKVILE